MLLALARADPPADLPAALWECEGEVQVDGAALVCPPTRRVPLKADSVVTVLAGRAVVSDPAGLTRTLTTAESWTAPRPVVPAPESPLAQVLTLFWGGEERELRKGLGNASEARPVQPLDSTLLGPGEGLHVDVRALDPGRVYLRSGRTFVALAGGAAAVPFGATLPDGAVVELLLFEAPEPPTSGRLLLSLRALSQPSLTPLSGAWTTTVHRVEHPARVSAAVRQRVSGLPPLYAALVLAEAGCWGEARAVLAGLSGGDLLVAAFSGWTPAGP